MAEIRAQLAPDTPIEVWFQDEMRVGQKNKLTYRWARKGSRLRAAHDQRTQSTYLFGAVCPERGAGAAVCTENLDSDVLMMQPADQGMRHNASDPLNWARDRRILSQGAMSSRRVVIVRIGF